MTLALVGVWALLCAPVGAPACLWPSVALQTALGSSAPVQSLVQRSPHNPQGTEAHGLPPRKGPAHHIGTVQGANGEPQDERVQDHEHGEAGECAYRVGSPG